MIADRAERAEERDSLVKLLPADRTWVSAAIIVNDHLDGNARATALHLAQHDGTRIILYDAQASSGWTSPFPPEGDIRPFLLDEPGVRRSGRTDVANAVRDLQRDGVQASAHLSSTRHAKDLSRLVASEQIDLVVCPVALSGALIKNVHLARHEGAHLLLCAPGQNPMLYPPLQAGDPVPVEQRIQLRLLLGILLTFLAAGLRNRSSV